MTLLRERIDGFSSRERLMSPTVFVASENNTIKVIFSFRRSSLLPSFLRDVNYAEPRSQLFAIINYRFSIPTKMLLNISNTDVPKKVFSLLQESHRDVCSHKEEQQRKQQKSGFGNSETDEKLAGATDVFMRDTFAGRARPRNAILMQFALISLRGNFALLHATMRFLGLRLHSTPKRFKLLLIRPTAH